MVVGVDLPGGWSLPGEAQAEEMTHHPMGEYLIGHPAGDLVGGVAWVGELVGFLK